MRNVKEKNIVVVCGGISSEREVSLRSGKAIFDSLCRSGFENVSLFDLKSDNFGELYAKKPDLCFLALHGKGGEDGCIQGALQLAGITYTGSGVSASAIAMDKILTKKFLEHEGIPTAGFVEIKKAQIDDVNAVTDFLIEKIGLPMVLKAPNQGSSIGVVIVNKKEQMNDAIDEVFKYGDVLLAEEFLDGVEVTLPILGNDSPQALPIIEITSVNEFYDYDSKYTKGKCQHILPARISDNDAETVQRLGIMAYKALSCRGFSRVDFIIDKVKGPTVIEINTIPGMTEMSLFPDSAREAGISFEELTERIVALAFE